MDLDRLIQMMSGFGVTQLLFKELAPNDNSKNQIYLASSLDILNVIPMGTVTSETTPKGKAILKAPVAFNWLTAEGHLSPAPGTQLIMYPQYPEVRLSGFLRASPGAPNRLLASREPSRLLLLGITDDRRVMAWAGTAEGLKAQCRARMAAEPIGLFREVQLHTTLDAEAILLGRLAEIASAGWIEAERLYSGGVVGPCRGTNCGGYTLEARLGIIPNGRSQPDFEGWEVKGHAVRTFDRLGVGQLTLMTPEPTGGFYRTDGPEAFIRRFGYPDSVAADRLNFSSPHRHGRWNKRTGLVLEMRGCDPASGRVHDPHGSVLLSVGDGTVAAEWSFAKLLEHWATKHDRAVYVPYRALKGPTTQYRYGPVVRLGRRTDFYRFLSAIGGGAAWYDPGLKLEGSGSVSARTKCRNQFRIRSANLSQLYRDFERVTLVAE